MQGAFAASCLRRGLRAKLLKIGAYKVDQVLA
jgi:hypothetical protein